MVCQQRSIRRVITFVLGKETLGAVWEVDGNAEMGAGRPAVGLLEKPKQMIEAWTEQ